VKKVRALVPVVVAAAAVVLSGCDIHPGVAAQVGDQSISMNTVDDTADAYCRAIEKQLVGNSQVVPQSYFRGGVAGTLALRSVAEQLATAYGVEPGKVYDKKVSDLQQQVAVLPDDIETAVVTIETGQDYVTAVQEAIGQKILQAQGTASPSYSQAADAGTQRFNLWIKQHGVEFDPSLNMSIDNGKLGSADTSLSYAVGSSARSGAADTPDPAYARALPASHRCG
jgi:peptidyl-prolyl cis-trans isomerase SurA